MKYIVSYSVKKRIHKKPEIFYGFSKWSFNRQYGPVDIEGISSVRYLKFLEGFEIITLDQFNKFKFRDEDIVILPFFNRNRLNHKYEIFTNQIKLIFGKNLLRDNTYLILGVTAESNGNLRRGNPDNDMSNEEAGDLVYKMVGKENQRIKLIVDGSVTYGWEKPTDNKAKLVSGNMFLEWAEDLVLNENYNTIFNNNIKKIENLEDRDKLFTCLQRRPRLCRFINLYNIHRYNLDNSGFYSLRLNSFDPVRNWRLSFVENGHWKVESENFKEVSKNFGRFIKQLKGRESYQCDDVDLNVNQALNLNPNHYLDSYFNVAVETLVNGDVIFLTEKIYKPIICGSPFFVLGNRGTISELRNMGFKTFDKWWDESYDDLYSHWERSKRVFSTLEELNKKPKSELNNILKEQQNILIDNYNRIKVLINEDKYIEKIIKLLI